MTELPLVFMAGLLGSSHCVGMCGGFAMMVGMGARSAPTMALAQTLFTLGRIFTYTMLGFVAGSIGLRLTNWTAWGINFLAVLAVVAGVILVLQGLATLGLTLWPRRFQPQAACLVASGFRSLLQGQGMTARFLAGVLTGLLPCGLVYGFVSLAAATGDPLHGGLLMTMFGLGTAPLMIGVGWGASLIGLAARQRILKVAACCVLLTGCLTVIRGGGSLRANTPAAPPVCPFCIGTSTGEHVDVR